MVNHPALVLDIWLLSINCVGTFQDKTICLHAYVERAPI